MEKAYRVTVFVPPSQLEKVLVSITKVLPENDSKYSEGFWWSSPGTEQFRPLEGSNPTIGLIGELSRLDSIELKFLILRNEELLNHVIKDGIRSAHPWEQPVITVEKCRLAVNGPESKKSKN